MITNYFDVKKDEEIVPYDRKLGYHHRVFYTSNYAADLKSTRLKKYLLEDYDEASTQKINIIKKYAGKMIPSALSANLTFYIARTFVILNIAYGIFTGDIPTVGSYMTMMLAVESLKNALNEMFYYVKDANRLGMYAKRIRAFFDVKSDIETDVDNKLPLPSGAYAVTFQNVCFSYANALFAIEDFNLEIKPGEKIAVVGENGAGKTTIVKLLLNGLKREQGVINIFGKDNVQFEAEIKKQIGVCLDQCYFDDCLNIKNITFIMKSIFKSWDSKSFLTLIQDLKIPQNKPINSYSKGMKAKLNIAIALSVHPKLLILDEPTSGLDPIVRDDILLTYKKYVQDTNSSILFSSHITSDIEKIADIITFIHKGEIIATLNKDEIPDNYGEVILSSKDFNYKQVGFISYIEEGELRKVLINKKLYSHISDIKDVSVEKLLLYFVKGKSTGENEC